MPPEPYSQLKLADPCRVCGVLLADRNGRSAMICIVGWSRRRPVRGAAEGTKQGANGLWDDSEQCVVVSCEREC